MGRDFADIGRLIRKRFDAAARRHNVTGTQWRVLLSVHRDPGITQGQLAEQLEVEPITTCRMVDRLMQAGLVERRRNPDDRRVWNLHLTQAALPLLDTMRAVGSTVVDQALSGMNEMEKASLTDLLKRVRRNLLDDSAFVMEEARHG